jgi:hypothetical protein
VKPLRRPYAPLTYLAANAAERGTQTVVFDLDRRVTFSELHEVVLGLHVVRGAVRRGDASRDEAGLQVFGERGRPAELPQIEIRQFGIRQRRVSFEA